MNDGYVVDDNMLSNVKLLMAELEGDNDSETIQNLVDKLLWKREESLFQELGKLTREFHQSLNRFRLDTSFAKLTEENIPDARDRLNHVIALTQESADKTLNAVEQSIPLCESILGVAEPLKDEWQRLQKKQMSADEFRNLAKQMGDFLTSVVTDSKVLKENLNAVLMAQDFQDLTSQMIHRVITLVEEVETKLVELIRFSSQKVSTGAEFELVEAVSEKSDLEGPQVPGKEKKDVVTSQDDVDDLLSSLGF